MAKRLVINADDFGYNHSINEAVRLAGKRGILTSATIAANMLAAAEAVQIAEELPQLGIGVHLNLTDAKPLSGDGAAELLVGSDGCFKYSPFVLAALSTSLHDLRKAIRAEFAAQIQWLVDRGVEPTHLDSHKHIHCFVSIYPIVCELAREFGIGAIRFCYEPPQLCGAPWPLSSAQGRKNAGLVRTMARLNRRQNHSFLKTDVLLGIAHLGKIDANFFKAVSLYNNSAVTEVMTHPSVVDLNSVAHRKVQFDALCDDRVKQYLADAHIELTHYGQL